MFFMAYKFLMYTNVTLSNLFLSLLAAALLKPSRLPDYCNPLIAHVPRVNNVLSRVHITTGDSYESMMYNTFF